MAAETLQHFLVDGDRSRDVAALDGASRSPAQLARWCGDENGRPVVPFGQATGHDADDPGRPGRMTQHQGRVLQQGEVTLNLSLCCLGDLIDQQPALSVQALQLGGQDAGTSQVIGSQQLYGDVGVGQPAQGIEARPQDEADVLLREPVGVEFSGLHYHLETQAFGVTQGLQPPLEQVARVAGLHRDVGHDPQSHQVEILCRVLGSPRSVVQRLHQFIGTSHSWQFAQGM